ncbi:uncharacterized protein B0H18DRAFT_1122448 [Fomitopsis serialis]|uniref:uncharacterized protein n=1 Tax=Fomitopsis serialis TaxID=139415 RepID=UPI0020080ECC|nr:uncharacterized protein B0H18DRAFT_1122448 [Neoantrodia serialis]KAH9919526.1 hypothetical protein B0H18DRAFT_1122448 [Neoantrodia serialis]
MATEKVPPPPTEKVPLRRLSPHIVEVAPIRIIHYPSSLRWVRSMIEAIYAHYEYYTAGVLHGDISEDNIRYFVGETEGGEPHSYGVVLDVDRCDSFKPFRRAEKLPVKSSYNEEEEVD